MALLKWKKGAGEWITFYADAIKNRLRRDLNLSDVFDKATARANLELNGDNNKTHFHDDRYIPLIAQATQKNDSAVKQMKIQLSGDVKSSTTSADSAGLFNVSVSDVVARKSNVTAIGIVPNTVNMQLAFVGGTGSQEIRSGSIGYTPATDTLIVTNIRASSVTADTVYGAVWNDYAEFFPRGEQTEPGDIVMLNLNAENEEYIKAVEGAECIAGVHSGEFSHIIGGELSPNNSDFMQHNLAKYIPVGLAGRVHVNFIGNAKKGGYVVPSEIPGFGRLFDATRDSHKSIIGFLVEEDELTTERKLKIKIK